VTSDNGSLVGAGLECAFSSPRVSDSIYCRDILSGILKCAFETLYPYDSDTYKTDAADGAVIGAYSP
jgi:hypothetical protein